MEPYRENVPLPQSFDAMLLSMLARKEFSLIICVTKFGLLQQRMVRSKNIPYGNSLSCMESFDPEIFTYTRID